MCTTTCCICSRMKRQKHKTSSCWHMLSKDVFLLSDLVSGGECGFGKGTATLTVPDGCELIRGRKTCLPRTSLIRCWYFCVQNLWNIFQPIPCDHLYNSARWRHRAPCCPCRSIPFRIQRISWFAWRYASSSVHSLASSDKCLTDSYHKLVLL